MAQIDARGLAKTYASEAGVVTALQSIDLSIEPGAYLAIMGPSGSGKTTLMNLLGLLDTPTGGRLILEGHDVSSLPPDVRAKFRNRRIGFVFQTYNLLPRWTALENVELPLIYAGMRRTERIARSQEMLATVGLNHRMTHLPAQLSGGEQQRVAIARAMVTKPALVLADEPTGALDSGASIQVMDMLRRFNAIGTTIILVTHDPLVAAKAQSTVHMKDGRIEAGAAEPSGSLATRGCAAKVTSTAEGSK